MSNNIRHLILLFVIILSFGCRKDPQPIIEQQETLFEADPNASITGFYLLNEGNMNMNKASLDFLDFTKGSYHRNIYNQANPEVTKGLGDVGNDIKIYGSKLYVVVNASNKIEVLDAKTGKRIKQIDLLNCRYLTFHGGKVYVSAYLAEIGNPKSPQGIVAEIDTTTLTETRRVVVGRQPEELAVVGETLYVANSGGYTATNYERSVSVVDLQSFTELKRIDVAVNLHRLKADQYGDLYVSSRGDYSGIPSRLYVIDTKKHQVKKMFDVPASNFWIDGDEVYLYSTEYSYLTGAEEIKYTLINVKDEVLSSRQYINNQTAKQIKMPYGIMVHPITGDVYVTDAKDYVSPGVLYCLGKNGNIKWQVETGDIPSGFALVYK